MLKLRGYQAGRDGLGSAPRTDSTQELSSRPTGGYADTVPTVKTNSLELKNDFTKDRDSGKRKVPLTPDRDSRGKKGGRVSTDPRLAAAPRVIVP